MTVIGHDPYDATPIYAPTKTVTEIAADFAAAARAARQDYDSCPRWNLWRLAWARYDARRLEHLAYHLAKLARYEDPACRARLDRALSRLA
jgi:hypothetical protein